MFPLSPVTYDLVRIEAARERDRRLRGRWIAALRGCCRGLGYRLGLQGQRRPVCCSTGAA